MVSEEIWWYLSILEKSGQMLGFLLGLMVSFLGIARTSSPDIKHYALEVESEPACDSVLCYVQNAIHLGFDALGLLLSNTIQPWVVGAEFLIASLIARLPMIRKVVGTLVIFLFLNMMVFMYLWVTDVFVIIWKVLKWICGLSLIAVIMSILKCLYEFCPSILGKKRRKKSQIKGKKGQMRF